GESSAAWTHYQLKPNQRQWLAERPLTLQLGRILLVHASADQPEQWRYVYDARAALASLDAATQRAGVRYVFGGHVHVQTLYYRASGDALLPFSPQPAVPIPVPSHRIWLATIGSVGQPRDGKPLAMYALFDTVREHITFHRVAYDYHAAAAAIRKAGLPAFFADRLEMGK
ncbi:MAG: metallophosphoesterase family protein, partial [Rhodoferax sp.]|nr:metallophosphoesterase family protein [Rhodoferax sp.]